MLCREMRHQDGLAQSLSALGRVEACQGNYAAACALYEESLAICSVLDDQEGVAACLEGLAGAVAAQGSVGASIGGKEAWGTSALWAVPPTQYASPSSGIPPTQYASPPSTDPYSSSAYSASAPTTDPYGSSAYGASSTPITNPYSSSPYEVSSAAPPPPASVTFTGTQKKGRRGLWIGLGAVAVLVIGGVAGFLILGAANASTPTKTLQVFCTAVKGHDTPTAYAQLSNAAKSQVSETQLAQNINAFNDCTVNNVNDAANTGILTYTLAGNLKINQEVTLVNEGGTWKINSQRLQSTPTLTLATYCEAVKKGDFQTAYNQFSQNYQSGQSEADFAKSFSQPIADCVPSNVNDSAGTGTVTYTYSGASSGTQIADETLVNQNGTWKIDSEKIRQ